MYIYSLNTPSSFLEIIKSRKILIFLFLNMFLKENYMAMMSCTNTEIIIKALQLHIYKSLKFQITVS